MARGKLSNNGKTIGFTIDNTLDNSAENDGHNIKVTVQGETFNLKQFHLHFGCEGPGSEHVLDGQKFGGEVSIKDIDRMGEKSEKQIDERFHLTMKTNEIFENKLSRPSCLVKKSTSRLNFFQQKSLTFKVYSGSVKIVILLNL